MEYYVTVKKERIPDISNMDNFLKPFILIKISQI